MAPEKKAERVAPETEWEYVGPYRFRKGYRTPNRAALVKQCLKELDAARARRTAIRATGGKMVQQQLWEP